MTHLALLRRMAAILGAPLKGCNCRKCEAARMVRKYLRQLQKRGKK